MPVCVRVFVFLARADGVMRTMNTEKLIKTLPTIQNQLDALLDFQVNIYLKETSCELKTAAIAAPLDSGVKIQGSVICFLHTSFSRTQMS